MEANQQSTSHIKKGPVHEGPKNHVIAFAISIALTLLAFIAVANASLNPTFTLMFIVVMAIVQVIVQMAFWMHMKDRGHLFPILGILLGCLFVFTFIIMAVFWVWW
jgi:cytochrome c oxidase subunit 4